MKFGIDRLLAEPALRKPLAGRRVALLAHPASVTRELVHSLDALAALGDVTLAAAFGPQHGLRGDKQDNMVESADFTDPARGIPVFSLYGAVRRPAAALLIAVLAPCRSGTCSSSDAPLWTSWVPSARPRMSRSLLKLPRRLQPRVKAALHEVTYAETRAHARGAITRFAAEYGAEYPKAVRTLEQDADALLTFFDFPAERLHTDAVGTSPNPFFGETSLDCPLADASKIAELPIVLSNSTGTVTRMLAAESPSCRAAGFTMLRCFCNTCSIAKLRAGYPDNGIVGASVSAIGQADVPVNGEADPALASLFCIAPTAAVSSAETSVPRNVLSPRTAWRGAIA